MTDLQFECRICGHPQTQPVLSLGNLPLPNRLPLIDAPLSDDICAPLDLVWCPRCTLLQITETVDPSILFREYLYFSSYSDTMLEHACELAANTVEQLSLDSQDHVVEIASNDGYLLQYYQQRGIPVLGIEPAENVAAVAESQHGIPTRREFFSLDLARTLRQEGISARVIHANNVLAHVDQLHSVVGGIKQLLAKDGRALIEVPYARSLIEGLQFDTIYHEHLCYFSVTALEHLFQRFALDILNVTQIALHGGSLLVTLGHAGSATPDPSVAAALLEEDRVGMTCAAYYEAFAADVHTLRATLTDTLSTLKAQGHSIAGYGAAAKATILLNFMEIGQEQIDYVADRSPHKQGRTIPGVRIPIRSPKSLIQDNPDYVVILAWNFKEEIIGQLAEYSTNGGRFIIPSPKVELV